MRRALPSPDSARPWVWAIVGAVAGLVVALVMFAPARWLAVGLTQFTSGHLRLEDPRGTVWNGSGRLVLAGGAGSRDALALPGRMDWQLRPAGMGMRASLRAECCIATPATVQARWQPGGLRLHAAAASSRWPAAVLAGLGTPWNTLQLDGDLTLSTQGLSVEWAAGRLALSGQAELVAQRMSSRLSTLRPMGSYRITLLGGTTPALTLQTLEGSLQLSGSGRWIGSRLRFTGEASAAPQYEAALSNLLNIIGRRDGARSIITIG